MHDRSLVVEHRITGAVRTYREGRASVLLGRRQLASCGKRSEVHALDSRGYDLLRCGRTERLSKGIEAIEKASQGLLRDAFSFDPLRVLYLRDQVYDLIGHLAETNANILLANVIDHDQHRHLKAHCLPRLIPEKRAEAQQNVRRLICRVCEILGSTYSSASSSPNAGAAA